MSKDHLIGVAIGAATLATIGAHKDMRDGIKLRLALAREGKQKPNKQQDGRKGPK